MADTGFLFPRAATFIPNFPSGASGTNWGNYTNILAKDNVPATFTNLNSGYTQYLVGYNFDFSSIPTGSVVTRIDAIITRKQTSGAVYSDKSVKLILTETPPVLDDSADLATATLYTTSYVDASYAWTTNLPSLGQMKVSTFGLALSAQYRSSCFVRGTLINTINGLVPIEKIKQGDMIVSFDKKLKLSKVNFIIKNKVKRTFTLNGRITASEEHPFKVDRGFKKLKDLKVGETVYILEKGILKPIKVLSLKENKKSAIVYGLSVDKPNTYFANGFLVHNKGAEIDVDSFQMKVTYNPPISATLQNEAILQNIATLKIQ